MAYKLIFLIFQFWVVLIPAYSMGGKLKRELNLPGPLQLKKISWRFDKENTIEGIDLKLDDAVVYPIFVKEKKAVVDLKLGKEIASGNFGTVYSANLCQQDQCSEVVIKRIFASQSSEASVKKEIALLNSASLDSAFPQLYLAFYDEASNMFSIVMEKGGASLEELKKYDELPLSESFLCALLLQYASALTQLHARGIIHRDIKPANLLYDSKNETVKIIDFGEAGFVDTEYECSPGCQYFRPPENCSFNDYGSKNDVFALGITFFWLRYGRFPQEIWGFANSDEIDYSLYMYLHYQSGYDSFVSKQDKKSDFFLDDQLDQLILKMLHPDKEKRISMAEISENSSFF